MDITVQAMAAEFKESHSGPYAQILMGGSFSQ